jgi:uncharacterized protein (DUF1015 family)
LIIKKKSVILISILIPAIQYEGVAMALVKPFRGLRPVHEYTDKVAALPYDVVSTKEALKLAAGNSCSFYHVSKPEIDLDPQVDPYDSCVYAQGAKYFKQLIDQKILVQDKEPFFYLYRLVMGEHSQTGLVACVSVQEYNENKIKKHELTKHEKEEDRLKHILALNSQTGPVFLTYPASARVDETVRKLTARKPACHFASEDGIEHTLWVINTKRSITELQKLFSKISCLYVADGHHRSAAAARASEILKKKNKKRSSQDEYNFFLAVLFPHDQVQILPYNRVIKDLNGLTPEKFLKKIGDKFLVRDYSDSEGYQPAVRHDFGMYLEGMWYRLSAIPGTWNENDPLKRLDVNILYHNLLKPVLGIEDPRKDKRIDYVGGIRGLNGLKAQVDDGEMAVAFSLFPTQIEDLLQIADAGEIMPPKSTWFEPKLRDGLVAHMLK